MSANELWQSLAAPINKVDQGKAEDEGIISILLPELELDLTDDEIISLTKRWKTVWETGQQKIKSRREGNDAYWKGETGGLAMWWGDERPLADNKIFEALETFLPVATKKNPEPVVDAGPDEASQKLADDTRKMLIYQADVLRLKAKMKKGVRNWALYLTGIWKMGWDEVENNMEVSVIRPQKMILDPDACINEHCEYTGEFLGEYKEDSAETMIVRFPKKKDFIKDAARGELGTKLQYIEWWTNRYVFYTMGNEVLAKFKNPHWNYSEQKKSVDEIGMEMVEEVPGSNHFVQPKMPYIFMTVFDVGLHPWDETSLIEQNQRLQDIVNKRIMQIDRNATKTNGATLISGDHYDQEEAGAVVRGMWQGDAAWVPKGDVNRAVSLLTGPALPGFVYESLVDARQELMSIFGVTALTSQGLAGTDTVRGKIMARTADDSRIGGGITEVIEQVYDSIFNWMVQMMYVYYTEEHVASVMGEEAGMEYATIRNDMFTTKLLVSVKEGSLIPEDPLTKRNEAIDLWSAGAIDPITLFKRLGDPNPLKAAEQLFKWQRDPGALFGQPMTAAPAAPQGGGAPAPVQATNDTVAMAQEGAMQAADLSSVPIQ